MKRLLCAFTVMLLLCSCSGKRSIPEPNVNSFNSAFQAKINSEEYRGTVSFDSDENMTVVLSYPDNIKGYSFLFSGDSVISSFDEVSDRHKISEYPDGFSFAELYSAFKTVASGELLINISDNSFEYKCGKTTLIADENGKITSAKGENYSVVFK